MFKKFILLLSIPLLFVGCDINGSNTGVDRPDSELTLTVKNAANKSAAQTNDIERNVTRSPQEGDELNIFVRGQVKKQETEFPVPPPGETREVSFIVPPGDYDVDLIAYEPNQNSVILGATTGNLPTSGNSGSGNVTVKAGKVTQVDFSTDTGDSSIFTKFNFNFSLDLQLSKEGGPNQISISLSDDIKNFIIDTDGGNSNTRLGGIGVEDSQNGDGIVAGDRTTATRNSDFSKSGETLETSISLPPGEFKSGEVDVLLEFGLHPAFEKSTRELSIFNNLDGSPETGIELDGDGGIIIIF